MCPLFFNSLSIRLISSLLPPLACHQCTVDLNAFHWHVTRKTATNLILVLINCISALTASQPRDSFHNATRVARSPIVIAPFDSPDLLLRPLLYTTVIRNVVTDVTDFCHQIAIVHQTVRDHTMCCSCITLHVSFAITPLKFSFLGIVSPCPGVRPIFLPHFSTFNSSHSLYLALLPTERLPATLRRLT
jgi:hypothetical protein